VVAVLVPVVAIEEVDFSWVVSWSVHPCCSHQWGRWLLSVSKRTDSWTKCLCGLTHPNELL